MAKWKVPTIPDENPLDYYEPTVPDPTVTDMVMEFQRVLDQKPSPGLYYNLILEEFKEWEMAPEGVEELKELSDLVYVIYGYALAKGYALDEAIYRVHKNNLGRCIQPDGTVKRRVDGKILKNPDYPKVDLGDLI